MKKTFLYPTRRAPKIQSRRLGLRDFASVAYLTDAETEQAQLLEKVKLAAKTEVEQRGYKNEQEINAIITNALTGMPLEALRKYEADKTQLETTLRNVAGELEKLQNRSNGDASKPDPVREMLEKKKAEIEQRFKSNPTDRQSITFNVRAAAVMATTNTIDEATNSITAAMYESMTMDAFVPKRRGIQFINDIADRQVEADLTQYRSWVEEGSEQGAFAIVAEGALKPLVSTALVRNVATTKKIAGKYVVTEEFAKFYANLYNIIRGLIIDKLQRDYAAQLVTDLNAQAASYTATTFNATIDNANDYDAVAAVAAQIMALNFVPDVLILHSNDLWRIRLARDLNGTYRFPIANAATGGIDMFGFTVVSSTYQTAGQFTLGESGLFKIREEPITIRLGYGVDVTGASPVTAVVSDFDNNRFRVIVETYFQDWIATPHIGSFVKATFSTVKAALETP